MEEFVPLTRSEKILYAIIHELPYAEAPLSRVEAQLIRLKEAFDAYWS